MLGDNRTARHIWPAGSIANGDHGMFRKPSGHCLEMTNSTAWADANEVLGIIVVNISQISWEKAMTCRYQ